MKTFSMVLFVMGLAAGQWMATCYAAGEPAGNENVLLLSGSDWTIHEDSAGAGMGILSEKNGWVLSTVPGNIQADLEAAHQLRPLWYGAGDPRLYEVARKDWWYRKDFVVPEKFKGQRLALVFDGVDHQCEVWLNGKQIGRNAGMFRRFWFDVAEHVKPGQKNSLAVRIARMPDQLAAKLSASDGAMSKGFLDGIHATRQTLKDLKSPTNFGWDWGVNIWTLGIWKDVKLVASGPARIDWTQVQTTLNSDYTKAAIRVAIEVDSLSAQPATASFRVFGNGQESKTTVDVALTKGANIVRAELPLANPALWWCNGRGEQPLYTLAAELRSGGRLIDARSTRFGVREVRWVHTQDAPTDHVSRYQLILNGQPVRTMGSSMIPPDLLFGRACPKGLQLLRRAKDCRMNLVRMWGGGVILPDEFHALADELGIMLSLEMPLANCVPEKDEVFLGNLEKTTQNIVKQVRNHPCIIEYTGGNEMSWNSLTKHPAWDVLQKVVRENDDRLIRATCPDVGAKHSPWDFNLNTSYAHYNRVSTMRYGEFGTQTPANLEVWHRTIPPKSQWPIQGVAEPILIRKNVVQAVFSVEHWLLKKRIDGAFGALDNLPDLIQAGQFLGADGLRYAIDANRLKGKSMGGFTTWDFNEPWLNGAGSYLVDYDGRTLMNYDFVKQALAPVSLALKCDSILYDPAVGVKCELWLASDAPQTAKDLTWTLLARDRRGKVFARERATEPIGPLEIKQLTTLLLTPPKETRRGPVFVETQLVDARGKLLVERLQVFGATGQGSLGGLLVNRGKDTVDDSVDETPVEKPDGKARPAFAGIVRRTDLKVTALPTRVAGDQEVLDLVVANTGPMTALFCEPHPLIEYRTDLFIDNNHCFIPPGQSRTITIRASRNARGGLSLAHTGWRQTAWNADDVLVDPSSDVVLAVGRRDAMCREFAGYDDSRKVDADAEVELTGRRPETSALPYLLKGKSAVRFKFAASAAQAAAAARLRLHTADQSSQVAPSVAVKVNGKSWTTTLPAGLGIQNGNPPHLAFPAAAEIRLPTGTLKAGENLLEVRISNAGWFTWDSLDIIMQPG